jgi:hypothetical protein
MEFTTQFGLHSQTIRLIGSINNNLFDFNGPNTLYGQKSQSSELEANPVIKDTTFTLQFPIPVKVQDSVLG